MLFEGEQNKSIKCLKERGFDFAYATLVFNDEARMTIHDCRYDYGEDRYITYGSIDCRLFCVVFTIRNGRLRIISARKANERELRAYGNDFV